MRVNIVSVAVLGGVVSCSPASGLLEETRSPFPESLRTATMDLEGGQYAPRSFCVYDVMTLLECRDWVFVWSGPEDKVTVQIEAGEWTLEQLFAEFQDQTGLRWTFTHGAVYGGPASVLEKLESVRIPDQGLHPALAQALQTPVVFCGPESGLPPTDMIPYLVRLTGADLRLEPLASLSGRGRFGEFWMSCETMTLRDALCWLAVLHHGELRVEDGSVIFRYPKPVPASQTQGE